MDRLLPRLNVHCLVQLMCGCGNIKLPITRKRERDEDD